MWKTSLKEKHTKQYLLLKKLLLEMFFPKKCLGCGKEKTWLCSKCFQEIYFSAQEKTILFPKKHPLTGLIPVVSYHQPLFQIILHQYKYHFAKELAEPLSRFLIKKLKQYPSLFKTKPVVIPVPLHPKRLRWRGFNQVELLAQKLSWKFDLPLNKNCLIRIKHSTPQVDLKNHLERKNALKNAFSLKEKINLKQKNIILIDDVWTTGATLTECAKILRKLKPKEIWGVVLAKASNN